MVIINYKTYLSTNIKFTGVYFTKIDKVFIKENLIHRYYGPATFYIDGYKYWYFNSEFYGSSIHNYTKKQFLKDLDKQWLL